MGNFSKHNEALHGKSMTPMMVMRGSLSFSPCIESNNHLGGHDITSSAEETTDSNTDQLTKREDHESLEVEKTHIRLISSYCKSPYYDRFHYQEGAQYSSCIILKGFSRLEIKKVQMVNDMKNKLFSSFPSHNIIKHP